MHMLTAEEFDKKVIDAKGVVVVDHFAEWCGPCKLLSPIIEKLAKKYDGKAIFYKLDVDTAPELAAANGVMGIPTVIAYKNGRELERIVGLQSETALDKKIDSWLKA